VLITPFEFSHSVGYFKHGSVLSDKLFPEPQNPWKCPVSFFIVPSGFPTANEISKKNNREVAAKPT
jgi:hypothetical protein